MSIELVYNKMTDSSLPENVELLRTRVIIEKDRVYSVSLCIFILLTVF